MGRISQPLLVFLLCSAFQSARGRHLFSDSKETPSAFTRGKRADSTVEVPGGYNVTVLLVPGSHTVHVPLRTETVIKERCLVQDLEEKEKELEEVYATNADLARQIAALQKKLKEVESSRDGAVKAQITELQGQLQDKINKLEVQTQDNSKLVLQITALQGELRGLKTEVAQATEAETTDLKRQLEEKEKQLKMRNKQLEDKNAYNAKLILKINELENEIWSLQQNQSDPAQVAELQKELQDTINKLQEQNNDNSKLVLQIIALQSQVRELQKKAADPVTKGQIVELQRQLEEKTNKLEEKDKDNSKLILQIINLQNEVKEQQRRNADMVAKEQIAELQRQLRDKDEECSSLQQRYDALHDQLTSKFAEVSKLQGELADRDAENSRLEALREQLVAKTKNCSRLQSQYDELQKLQGKCEETEELQKQLSAWEGKISRLERQLKDKDSDISTLERGLRDKESENSRLERELRDKESENSRLERELRDKESENSRLERELRDKEDDYSRLQRRYNELQGKKEEEEDTKIRAAVVTMDGNTAHPKLSLSRDGREVAVVNTRNVPDNPERFDTSLAIMAKDGFASGRHYWEVKVEGKACYSIGVAAGSAGRKGRIVPKPSKGFWTIILTRNGDFRALAGSPVTIPMREKPNKIGVYLDYKGGEVAFYNPENRSHMYSFTGQVFQEKMYPFIMTCEDSDVNEAPLVLTHVGTSLSWLG
ncbi:E3 ubiquitin-protein ligase TRIM39 [Megalops cyprinoides]|uniref:E3 ubiquitin-protein ligase TRIM39 n=1 Tax=Megalops cyprinoides TaxID=118141 RepID=UPI0018650B20|nr:E3 ubiquitin-protein ligase TRIM39 [Megalops cyprinoides]